MTASARISRRADLDALRIFAFLVLIFYHTGMGYVSWGWHVKSAFAGPELQPFMSLINPWRLPLLFFISGAAMAFLAGKLGAARFALDRVWRLFIPLCFGVFVIVAPQTYFQLRESGEIGPGFLDFYRQYVRVVGELPFSVITPTWNHLWYVAYILIYSLILAPFLPLLRHAARLRPGRIWEHPAGPLLVFVLPVLPLLLYRFTLVPIFPTTHNLVADWANHAVSLTLLVYGIMAAHSQAFWRAVDRAGPYMLAFVLLSAVYLGTAYSHWDEFSSNPAQTLFARILRIGYAWAMILTLVWGARRIFTRTGPVLERMSMLIFPVYIFHQTITVSAIYLITRSPLHLGGPAEFALVAAITLAGSWALAEAGARLAPLRPLIGMKLKNRRNP